MKNLKLPVILLVVLFFISFDAKAQLKLKLYGGKNHDQFLGYITYIEDDELNSIWSEFSEYGIIHSAKSIWNEEGIYGSKTSDYSPFNINAKYPPQIRDKNGKSYGYLTINKSNPNQSQYGMDIYNNRDIIVEEGPENYGKIYHTIHCGGGMYTITPIVVKPIRK
jgi:hypothetical protein